MRVLVVSAVYPPEPVVSAQTSAQLAQGLAAAGHEVAVLAPFPSRPGGRLYPGYSRRLFSRTREDGYDVIRCFAFLSSTSSVLSRAFENISFGVTSALYALVCSRPNVIYSNSWPMIATSLLALVARVRRIPFVLCVQDMYPESLISQKRIRDSGWAARMLYRLDGIIARGCAGVVTISDAFAESYRNRRKMEAGRLRVIPNWVDAGVYAPDPAGAAELRTRLKVPQDATLFVYAGNVGVAAGLETVIAAFRHLADVPHLYLLIAGEGTNLPVCRELARQVAPDRIVFLTPWRREQTSAVLEAADVLLLPTRGRQSVASVPSKALWYMLSGRPVITLAVDSSDLARLIEESGCGWIVAPDDPLALASEMRRIASLEGSERREHGEHGRTFVREHRTRDICLPRVIRVLEAAAMSEPAASKPVIESQRTIERG
jgi:colanic acid biosynthesis glycosyl transferase WcaI